MNQELLIESIKNKIEKGLKPDFSGLGIIVVDSNTYSLPMIPLLKSIENLELYSGEDAIVDYLFKISSCTDKRHDGFHIVSKEHGLVLISQFFSPPIPQEFCGTIFDVGARHRTAQYGSLCENVSSIITISQSGIISVAQNGIVAQAI